MARSAILRDSPTTANPNTAGYEGFVLKVVQYGCKLSHTDLQFPLLNVLIELAVEEHRPDEVLHWYDRRRAGMGGWLAVNDDLVAGASADSYSGRAIAIWTQPAEAQVGSDHPTCLRGGCCLPAQAGAVAGTAGAGE